MEPGRRQGLNGDFKREREGRLKETNAKCSSRTRRKEYEIKMRETNEKHKTRAQSTGHEGDIRKTPVVKVERNEGEAEKTSTGEVIFF